MNERDEVSVGAPEPDPEFVDHLEWQLRREMRRRRLDATPASPGWLRWARTAALVVVGLAAGAGAMAASQALEERWRQDLLEARYEVQLEVAQQAIELQQRVVDQVRTRAEIGVMSQRDLTPHELGLAQARAEARQMALQLEEIRLSGGLAGGGVSSPRVAGRDFFTEGLRIRLDLLRRQQEMLQSEVDAWRRRQAVGTASRIEVRRQEAGLQEVVSRVQSLEEQLQIREAFLNGEVTGVEAELRVQQVEAGYQERSLREQLDLARSELERVRTRIDVGTAEPLDVAYLELHVDRLEAELELVAMEQTALARRLAEEAGRR